MAELHAKGCKSLVVMEGEPRGGTCCGQGAQAELDWGRRGRSPSLCPREGGRRGSLPAHCIPLELHTQMAQAACTGLEAAQAVTELLRSEKTSKTRESNPALPSPP